MEGVSLVPMSLSRFINVSKVAFRSLTRTAKVKQALKDPRWAMLALWNRWQFENTNSSRLEFIARLLDTTAESAASMLSEVRGNNALYEHLVKGLNKPLHRVVAESCEMGEILYVIVRLLKPDIVVETGVFIGMSSCFILQAEEDNGQGELYSIDLPSQGKRLADGHDYHLAEKQSGWIIPEDLRHRWHLILGDSRKELPPLLEQLGSIDVFLHDSLHTFEHQKWEYETAWPFIKEGGLLLSDDISRPFIRFCDQYGAHLNHYGFFGGLRKRA